MGNFTEDYVLGLDLGGDTVKLTFAYEDPYGKNVFGKIDSGGNDSVLNVAIPAIAYYDEEKNKWYYCNEVDTCEASSYSTIVKIKTLLSLLKYDKKKMSVSEENAGYYRNSYYFPKFYFPRAKRDLKNYKKDIAEERVFLSNKKIVEVCEGFFVYLKKFTEKRMDIYGKKFGYQFKLKDVGITYPFGAGQEYIDELARLVKFGFGILPAKKLNSTKALGWLAFYLKKAEQDEKLLVFDMGEESISVSKAFFVKDGSRKKHIAVDGVDAHNDALELGGLEVDEAIAAYLENKIGQREVFGMPHYGEEGYIKEKGVYENEYILLKNIKKAKILLGSDYADDEFFKDGVPIEIIRDFYLQLRLTKEEMKNCVWEKGSKNSIYSKICDYVKKEADRSPTNNDVHKIIVTGGLSESYYLLDYLREEMRKKNVEVLSFDYGKTNEDADSFEIMKYEDSVYAASLGAAIVTLENYSVKTVLSYSYGSWLTNETTQKKYLNVFADKGEILDEEDASNNIFLTSDFTVKSADSVKNEEIYAVAIPRNKNLDGSIKSLEYVYKDAFIQGLFVGGTGPEYVELRKTLKNEIGFKVVAGGISGEIIYKCKDDSGKYKRVRLNLGAAKRLRLKEGISVDQNGKATPIAEVGEESLTELFEATFVDTGKRKMINGSDLKIEFNNVNEFSTED